MMPDKAQPPKTRLADAVARLPDAQRDRVTETAQAIRTHDKAPPMKLDQKDGALHVCFDCEDAQIGTLLQMADIGTKDADFHFGLISQIANLGSHRKTVDSDNSNFVFAVMRSVKPRDELEAMLATQMGAIHAATMMMARKLNQVTTIQQQDSAERTLNKLARTFTIQMDALKRYRTGGQQKVIVEHVTVNSGGQAIVGALATGGGGGN